ncbi:WXG100 family type VII secretion target [Nocardioides daedukensis]|uniref:ESAT-6-like protein n=1 Tax=Nocardioides daedukensis TaxID=634462 RepID=A0A7Y9UQX2_9ACTN|nr:WXG100 family type VII secretion target [Nocardioides daedukensis]NYG59036.1 WXG100 family type VII secretion target [Nocardioides daedukensis]
MGLGDMKVGYEALDQAAADLKNGAVGIENKLDELERRMRGRQSEWTGEASLAFESSRHEWDRAMKDMKSILHDIGLGVGLSREEYAAAEGRNKGRFPAADGASGASVKGL